MATTHLAATSEDAKDNGANSHKTAFLQIQNLLMANYATFDLTTCLSLRGDIPAAEVVKLFKSFTRQMIFAGKLRAENGGCYDSPTYAVTGA